MPVCSTLSATRGGIGGRVRELAILTTAASSTASLNGLRTNRRRSARVFPSRSIEIIKHRKNTNAWTRPRDRHRAGPRDLRCEEGGVGDFRPVITAVRPPRAGRSRRPHGQLCRDSALLTAFDMQLDPNQPPSCRHEDARPAHNSQAVDQDCGGKGAPIRRARQTVRL